MALVQDRCICVRKVEYSETSQILLLLSRRHGLVRAIAKGAHRTTKAGASSFGGGIDLLDLADAVFTESPEKDLATLTEWKLRDGHLELRRSLRGVYLAFLAAELVALLIEEHDAHPEVYDLLERTLPALPTPQAEEAFLAFELSLLRQTGYLPELQSCGHCLQPLSPREAAYFSPRQGGVICRKCEAGFPDRIGFDRRLLDVLQYILRLMQIGAPAARLPRLTRHQTDPLNRLLIEHVEHTLGRQLRLRRYVLRNVT